MKELSLKLGSLLTIYNLLRKSHPNALKVNPFALNNFEQLPLICFLILEYLENIK